MLNAIALGAPILGGIIGNVAGNASSEEARKLKQQALNQWANLTPPSSADQRIGLGRFSSVGTFNPQLEGTIQQGQTAFSNVKADPALKAAQHEALNRLQLTANGGMTTADKNTLNKINLDAAQADSSRRGALMQNMAARGMGGSGSEIAAQLQAQQSGTNAAAQHSREVASQAQMRALAAIAQSGQLAGDMRSQQFNEQSEGARAQDIINQFNARNSQNAMTANTDRMNNAQAANYQNSQNIQNMNTQIGNQEEMHNKGLQQQGFMNKATIAQGMSGQLNSMAGDELAEAQRRRRMWGGIGQGIGEGALVYGMRGN